jgi:hypothetical protein
MPHRRTHGEPLRCVDDGVGVHAVMAVKVVDGAGLAEMLDAQRYPRFDLPILEPRSSAPNMMEYNRKKKPNTKTATPTPASAKPWKSPCSLQRNTKKSHGDPRDNHERKNYDRHATFHFDLPRRPRSCTHKTRFVSELDACPLSGVLQTQTGHRLRSEKCQERTSMAQQVTSAKCQHLTL